MLFKREGPSGELKDLIECYWFIESDEKLPSIQKIIPDGFPEIIFHYGDPFRINISKKWEEQEKFLLAGQIKKHFFLENTGRAGVFGIKLKPAALSKLFRISMELFTDKVLPLANINDPGLTRIGQHIDFASHQSMIQTSENYLVNYIPLSNPAKMVDSAIDIIGKSNGLITVTNLCREIFVTERQLQRLFKQYTGLSPKYYARIIRFNYLFQLIQEGKTSWTEITYHSGYFDQSHFIRDFKSFTGVDPSSYYFSEKNIANFFLNKK